jgi:hypothetical protein
VTVRLPAPGPIAGAPPNAGALPAGFAHPHASEEARLIAEAGLILRVHGYDTKYAMHALRLGLQGIELLTTGRITLPVPEPDREYLRSIRRGERPLAEVLAAITEAEDRLERLRDGAAVPDEPDRRWVDDWLHRSYLDFWASLA